MSQMDDLQAAAERWSLTLGEVYERGAAGYTTRATPRHVETATWLLEAR